MCRGGHGRAYTCLQRYSPKLCYGDATVPNCWIKSLLSFDFHTKHILITFITLRLNHWWQMHYFVDLFHTFLDQCIIIFLPVNRTVTSLPVFILNILNCVPKTNEVDVRCILGFCFWLGFHVFYFDILPCFLFLPCVPLVCVSCSLWLIGAFDCLLSCNEVVTCCRWVKSVHIKSSLCQVKCSSVWTMFVFLDYFCK